MALHSLDKASESVLKKVMQRFQWVREHGIDPGEPANELFLLMTDGKQLSTEQFLRMDDCYLWDRINQWAMYSQDKLLSELANRMLRHNLFKFVDVSKYGFEGESIQELTPVYNALKAHYDKRGLAMEFCFDEALVQAKPMYQPTDAREPIWIRTGRGNVVDLREVSSFSLSVKPDGNIKHLVFVWDREAMNVLIEALERHLPDPAPTSEEVVLENEGWL
jgi:HD superfamily phosphohydrolase